MDATSTTANCARAVGRAAMASTPMAMARPLERRRGLDMCLLLLGWLGGGGGGLEEGAEPAVGLAAVQVHERLHALQLHRPARDHLQLRLEATQIELRHDAVVTLLDEEAARSGLQALADQAEFPFGQAEAFGVILPARFRIREEDLGRGLLDDGPADRALQHIARALRRQAHDPIELAPGLRA